MMLLGLGLFSLHFPIIFLVSLRERSLVSKQKVLMVILHIS